MDTTPSSSLRIRHGHRLEVPAGEPWWDRERAVHDARLDLAFESIDGAVAVLQSAVLLHGGTLKNSTDQAHVWVRWNRSLRRHPNGCLWNLPRPERRERLARRPVVNHAMTLDEDEIVVLPRGAVTDLGRTTLDAARFLPPDEAFVAVESLLAVAAGRDPWWRRRTPEVLAAADEFVAPLLESLCEMPGHRGVAQARDILSVASPLSESAWESELRRIALAAGYVDLEPQLKVRTARGPRWMDLAHRRLRRGLEVNGDVKYHGPGGTEKRAEEAARAADLEDVGFRIIPLSVEEVQNVPGVLDTLSLHFGETRSRAGRSRLWTPIEKARWSSR